MGEKYRMFWYSVLLCCLQSIAFGLVSYGLMYLIYGGVRIALLHWLCIVTVAFLLIHIPTFTQHWRRARR